MLSTGDSLSSELLTHIAPGTAQNGFNVTVVAYASDNLGATGATSLGSDGIPLAFASIPPDEVRIQEHEEQPLATQRSLPTKACSHRKNSHNLGSVQVSRKCILLISWQAESNRNPKQIGVV